MINYQPNKCHVTIKAKNRNDEIQKNKVVQSTWFVFYMKSETRVSKKRFFGVEKKNSSKTWDAKSGNLGLNFEN